MTAPLLLDLTHTSHTHARTGIQRVARSLQSALGPRAIPITHDPHLGAWRPLQAWEERNLSTNAAAAKRSAQWPLAAKLRGRLQRVVARSTVTSAVDGLGATGGLLMPEIFSPNTAAALPALFSTVRGPRVALFHDAIAVKLPELTPPKTVARFPAYLQELLAFDGIAAVSNDSRDALVDYWRWLGAPNPPPVQAIPLGVDPAPARSNGTRDIGAEAGAPVVLSVGTIEGRKNHVALLDACESLWARGVKFELRLIGFAQRETGAAALTRIETLQAAGRSVRYDGPVSDTVLEAAYAECAFTVYPSLVEGFGLPVLESVARGKPCICSARGALGEAARGGGCVALPQVDTANLATAIERLLASPEDLSGFSAAARARHLRTWPAYAEALLAWMGRLSRRS